MSGSPLERLRATYEARQQARTLDVPLWDGGQLIARVGMVDTTGARDAMRTMMRLLTDEAGDLTQDDVAGVIAAATRGLYARDESGTLQQIMTSSGEPLTFDGPEFGRAIGYDEITTPVGAVIVAFTEGDPPTVNAMRMVSVATRIASWLAGADRDAEDAVSGR